ncbi:hypothetical protein VSH64_10330 [Amycolatopsis rhabdoformis]|uniref:Transaldolase n=1 Tax=Amycolatopsis rhabdoformis TaxID=1448059 RepID=A0ABZ1IFH5_9PSEU|nr:hypothetical protein [Amycolatopsis rhabdoformis]WSE32501.1 hypothetical protein VSH64_10330 [Amycolatopsis rhabdoformis]
MTANPRLTRGLFDDAAVFPPGLMPLPEAVSAHARHRTAPYAELVGPLVLAASTLDELEPLLLQGELLDLSVTCPQGAAQLPAVFAAADRLPVRLRGVEVAMPPQASVAEFFAALDTASDAGPGEVPVFVEVPRDSRGAEVVTTLANTGYLAKFRTGGVTAELYPGVAELAAAIALVVAAGVAFKATAGLHHAIRNTDPATGFDQHGFLNLLAAVGAALDGADERELAAVLADRDGAAVAARASALDADAVRSRFLSFGTCSVLEPLAELVDLGVVPDPDSEGTPA